MDETVSRSSGFRPDERMKDRSGQDVLVCWIVAVVLVAIIAASSWVEAVKVEDPGSPVRWAAHSSISAHDRYAGRLDLSDLGACDPEERPDLPLISASREIGEIDDTVFNC
jgi:hypothetical protein